MIRINKKKLVTYDECMTNVSIFNTSTRSIHPGLFLLNRNTSDNRSVTITTTLFPQRGHITKLSFQGFQVGKNSK